MCTTAMPATLAALAVGRGFGHRVGADDRAAAGAVVDDHALPKCVLQALGDEAAVPAAQRQRARLRSFSSPTRTGKERDQCEGAAGPVHQGLHEGGAMSEKTQPPLRTGWSPFEM
jgi:hypothetical protein